MRFVLYGVCCFLFTVNVNAEITRYVSVEYRNDIAIVNYDVLEREWGLSHIDIYECAEQPIGNESCDGRTFLEKSASTLNRTYEIKQSGLYFFEFYSDQKKCRFCKQEKKMIWEQYFVLFDSAGASLRGAIAKYAPLFSFHADENYYPVSVSKIFDRPIGDFDIKQEHLRGVRRDDEDSALDYFRFNGHSSNKIKLKRNIALAIRGNQDNFPAYWLAEQLNELEYHVTYFTLYAFDEKHPQYVQNTPYDIGSKFVSHELDRESVTIHFKNENGEWKPVFVYYSGHLEDQKTFFRGCNNPDCSHAEDTVYAAWENGKTKVRYENVAMEGGRPIVYVAHGSHANTPAYGYYFVDVSIPDAFLPLKFLRDRVNDKVDVLEAAGSRSKEQLKTPRLVELDLSVVELQPLSFSGSVIQVANKWARIHPFVRYPTSRWVEGAGTEFNDCVVNKRGCELFIKQEFEGTENRIERVTNFSNPSVSIYDVEDNNGQTFVAAPTSYDELQLLRTRGTLLEPVVLADTYPSGHDAASSLTSYEGNLYWLARDEAGDSRLHKLDNAGAATIVCGHNLIELCPTPTGLGGSKVSVVGSKLIVTMAGEAGNTITYSLDSQSGRLKPVRLTSGEIAGSIREITALGENYFMKNSRVGFTALDIYQTDENFETIERIAPKILYGDGYGSHLQVFNESLYFSVVFPVPNGRNLNQLWGTDGFTSAQLIHDFGQSSTYTGALRIAASDNRLYVLTLFGVLSSEATEESTIWYPGLQDFAYGFETVGSTLYVVSGRIGSAGNGPTTIYSVQDGDESPTIIWTGAGQISPFDGQSPLRKFRDELYFIAAGPVLQKISRDGEVVSVDIGGVIPQRVFPGNDSALYIQASDLLYGNEIYRLN